jgi:hypothetical protein
VDHTEDSLILNVNRHHRMAKEPGRLPVMTAGPRASPSERSWEEVDLDRILSSNNSPSVFWFAAVLTISSGVTCGESRKRYADIPLLPTRFA